MVGLWRNCPEGRNEGRRGGFGGWMGGGIMFKLLLLFVVVSQALSVVGFGCVEHDWGHAFWHSG